MNKMNSVTLLQQEKAEALSYIDVTKFSSFLYLYAEDQVGKDHNGNPTTLMQEIGEVAKLSRIAYAKESVNYYRSRSAYASVENNDELASDRLYVKAAKKILFLASVAKKIGGRDYGFLCKKVNKDDIVDMISLVNAFDFIVRHYYMADEEEVYAV